MRRKKKAMSNERSGGNDFDEGVNGIADFVLTKMSGGGENNVFIGSEYLIWPDETVNRQTA